MVDKVKPLKLEDTTDGTEFDMTPTETNPTEDYLAAKGLAIENSDLILIDASGNEIQFTDPTNGTKSISDLLDAEQEDFDPTGTILTSTKTGPAIREIAAGGIPIDALTEFEAFSDDAEESTTSNGWVTKNNFPYTTSVKSAGDYVVDFSAQIGQSDKEKTVGFRVQWREGTSGSWTTLADARNGLGADDGTELRTAFRVITLSSDTEFQIRIQWGQTDDGGTGTIQNATIKIGKVA